LESSDIFWHVLKSIWGKVTIFIEECFVEDENRILVDSQLVIESNKQGLGSHSPKYTLLSDRGASKNSFCEKRDRRKKTLPATPLDARFFHDKKDYGLGGKY
jgi:hypothetical protein